MKQLPWKEFLIVIGGIAVLLILMALLVVVAGWSSLPKEVALPILAISGVVFLLATLTVLAVSFSIFSMVDKTQAFALPEGSIRAVIALSLIVIFAILTVYLYTDISNPDLVAASNLTLEEKDRLVANGGVVTTSMTGQGDTARYTAYFLNPDQGADDFAKQLLVMLGTLVTSIAAFYFGSRGAAAGAAAAPPNPTLRAITPTDLPRDGNPHDFELSGENLARASDVKIVSGGNQVIATDVVSGANLIKFKLTADAAQAAGKWDVIVTTADGKTAELTGALTLT